MPAVYGFIAVWATFATVGSLVAIGWALICRQEAHAARKDRDYWKARTFELLADEPDEPIGRCR